MATPFMCFAMGLLYCLPCMTHVGNQAGLGLLLCISDNFVYNIQIAKAISSLMMSIVGYLSKLTLTAIKTFRLRLIYVVAAVLGLVLLCIYMTLAGGFLVCAIAVVHDNLLPLSPVIASAGVLCIWILVIYVYCSHLLLGFMAGAIPTSVVALAWFGYISTPSYPLLWTIMLSSQFWSLLIQGSGTIDYALWIVATLVTTICAIAPWSICLFLWLLVLVFSYAIACCIGVVLLAIVYPRVVVKNYTKRWRRLVPYGGQSYRTILFSFAWLFQARPLYIVVFFVGVWTVSRLTL